MKLLPRPTSLADVGWLLALCIGLWLFYLLFHFLGFTANDSKGLSLLALLMIILFGLFAQRRWIKSRWDSRFDGISLEQKILELDKIFDEQVAAGIITRAEVDEIKAKAKAKFDRDGRAQ